jgi:hypothetical protein
LRHSSQHIVAVIIPGARAIVSHRHQPPRRVPRRQAGHTREHRIGVVVEIDRRRQRARRIGLARDAIEHVIVEIGEIAARIRPLLQIAVLILLIGGLPALRIDSRSQIDFAQELTACQQILWLSFLPKHLPINIRADS